MQHLVFELIYNKICPKYIGNFRLILYEKIQFKLEQKMPINYIVNFQYISDVSDIYTTKYTLSWNKKRLQIKSEISNICRKFPIYTMHYATKYTLSRNKKRLQNKSKISDLFCRFFCSNLKSICREMLQKNDFFPNGAAHFVTLRDKYTVSWNKKVCKISRIFTIGFFVSTYSVFVAKCNKINNIFPNGEWGAIWKNFGKILCLVVNNFTSNICNFTPVRIPTSNKIPTARKISTLPAFHGK